MKLIDIISNIKDTHLVRVFSDGECKELARYDGRDSIPTEYNDWEVTAWTYSPKTHMIFIKEA